MSTWPLHRTSSKLVPFDYITGRVEPRAIDLFDYFCDEFDRRVENIEQWQSWGWNFRTIRGTTASYSKHAYALAIDLNATKHPLGKRNTFTSKQRGEIRKIQLDVGGPSVLRCGMDYQNRPDDMHFEIMASPERVKAVIADLYNYKANKPKVNTGNLPKVGKNPKLPDVSLTDIVGQINARQKQKSFQVMFLEQGLVKMGGTIMPDGWWDPSTQWTFKNFQQWVLKWPENQCNGLPGATSLRLLAELSGRFEAVA